MTAIRLTDAQARKVLQGRNISSVKEATPPTPRQTRAIQSPEQQQARQINKQVSSLLKRFTGMCESSGWHCDAARHFTTDERDEQYRSVSDDYATPNCLVLWRVGRVEVLCWLWETLSDEDVVKRLQALEEVR